MKIIPLKSEHINPACVISDLQSKVDQIEDIYVVVIDKNKQPSISATGDLKTFCFAATVLQGVAMAWCRGEMDED